MKTLVCPKCFESCHTPTCEYCGTQMTEVVTPICNCHQCRSIRYAMAIIKAEESGRGLNIARVLKHFDNLHFTAIEMICRHMLWDYGRDPRLQFNYMR